MWPHPFPNKSRARMHTWFGILNMCTKLIMMVPHFRGLYKGLLETAAEASPTSAVMTQQQTITHFNKPTSSTEVVACILLPWKWRPFWCTASIDFHCAPKWPPWRLPSCCYAVTSYANTLHSCMTICKL